MRQTRQSDPTKQRSESEPRRDEQSPATGKRDDARTERARERVPTHEFPTSESIPRGGSSVTQPTGSLPKPPGGERADNGSD